MRSGSALHFLPTPTLALHIKRTFVTKSDKEIFVNPVFIIIVYKCSLFITAGLSRSHYKIFTPNVKTTRSHSNIRLETCMKAWGPVGLVLQFNVHNCRLWHAILLPCRTSLFCCKLSSICNFRLAIFSLMQVGCTTTNTLCTIENNIRCNSTLTDWLIYHIV
jgi:hypothetical protein